MRRVVADRVDAGLLDVFGRVEVGLADLHVHDAAALRFERLRAGKDFERALAAEAAHGFAQIVGVVGNRGHVRRLPRQSGAIFLPKYSAMMCCATGAATTAP